MGKNHRHKKFLKSEKAKIKLKNKIKFLPKGQNITDLSFKIKPIVLTEQLKSKENQVLSSRKLNLKEILNRMTHHNVNIKCENCQQLKELLHGENQDFLKQNLAGILKKLCPLILDVESRVRHEAIKVIKEILKSSASIDISSFFDILSSILRCAMTHIDLNVQEDSLYFLDCLLETVPDLIATDSHKILSNFFTLISKLKSDSKNARVLSENLKSKYTAVKWRIKVMLRLKMILEAVFKQNCIELNSSDNIAKTIDVRKSNFAPIYSNAFDYLKQKNSRISIEIENMENYIDTLLPLLQETWLEVAPSNVTTAIDGKTGNTIIKNEVANVLHCVLSIFYFLFKLAEAIDKESDTKMCLKFKSEAYFTFLNNILSSFPFSGAQEKKHEIFGVNNDIKCTEENLLICYLFSVQYRNIRGRQILYAEKVLCYLAHCVNMFSRNKEYANNKMIFTSALKIILERNLICWKQADLDFESLIGNVVEYYFKTANYNSEIDLLILLFSAINDRSEKQMLIAEKSCNYLLKDKIPSEILDFLLLMVKKEVSPIQNCLRNKLKEILDNIKRIEIDGLDLEFIKIVRILCLYHYVPLTPQDIVTLKQFSANNAEYRSNIECIICT
ncbi:hypothetical protein MML48_9g00001938 [Holotrichia oblita]|uniref:Uncharacterized protein n=1 Tax=Holotrichia oblita TaxID=644536 RepID=A0ACB9SIZ2_HOLOL|nr:hypothetical protein MML48_9g00001938 [Holotrichia oblita]